jgi:pimeloyl-ACP methyl ester carboxylesterase
MAEKELWVYLLAYNLIRLMMVQAALMAGRLPRELSFKHTLQLWLVWTQRRRGSADDHQLSMLFILIAQQQAGNRPGRIEPRAVKRRPKPFPLLTQPRAMDWFNDLQRMTTSAENAVRLREAVDDIDITDLLGRVNVPTLVLHCRGDAVQPFAEGRRLAAMIADSRFVTLEGENHLFLEDEPAWSRFRDEVRSFLINEILRAD